MRNFIIITILILSIISLGSCRKDFDTIASTGNLIFSKQTVYLDTVFTNIGSSTYNLKVYNTGSDDIHIPTISLENGATSQFRLMVDGIAGQSFENIEVKAKDSIFIFVETTLDILDYTTTATEFLYTDNILFDANNFTQKVELVTLVKDAVLLYPEQFSDGTTETLNFGTVDDPEEVYGFYLDPTLTELTWTNEKPYVIYGYAAVPACETLTIEQGARIHFHRDAGLIIPNCATIIADGDVSTDQDLLENEIIFEGDRLEQEFSDIPGQWGTIWLQDGSTNNFFDHVTIKNGTIGLRIDNFENNELVTIHNTQLYNHSINGLLAIKGSIEGDNIVVGNCGQASVNLVSGGIFDFKHCTFTNYWNNGFRSFPTLLISNSIAIDDTLFVSPLNATFTNCIVYGSEDVEFSFSKETGADFNYKFTNCLLRFNDSSNQFDNNPLYDFNNPTLFEGNRRNEAPVFLDKFNNQFQIEESVSPADNNGLEIIPSFNDILNTARTNGNYDIGAYQASVFPTDG